MFICKKDLAILVKKNNGFGKIEIPTIGKIKQLRLNGNLIVRLAEGKEIELSYEKAQSQRDYWSKRCRKLRDELEYDASFTSEELNHRLSDDI